MLQYIVNLGLLQISYALAQKLHLTDFLRCMVFRPLWSPLHKYPRCYRTITENPTKYQNDKVVVFNLKIPIKRQLEGAEKFLKKELKESKIKPKQSFPKRDALLRYWRVLDAKAEGNNNSNIGKFLYKKYKIEGSTSPSKRAKDDYDRAKEYRDETYIFLIDYP